MSNAQFAMFPFTVLALDCDYKSHSYESASISHPDHVARDAIFLTNIKYIFDDDEIALQDGAAFSDERIENVVVIEVDAFSSLRNVELVSDHFQLLNYKLGSENDITLEIISKFRNEAPIPDQITLNELIDRYRTRNNHLQILLNGL